MEKEDRKSFYLLAIKDNMKRKENKNVATHTSKCK